MTQFWGQLEGSSIADTYALGKCLKFGDADAIYETHIDGAVPAVVRIHDAEGADAEILWERWSTAAALSHEHLIRVFSIGRSAIRDKPFIYIVMERADEALDGALAERPLSHGEASETLAPTLEALRYLHEQNLVHGAIRPSNVMAVADTVKLSSDTIGRSQDDGVHTAASDVRSVGELLWQALTLTAPEWRDGALVGLANLNQPFRNIVGRCLETDPARRWTIQQISDALHGRAVSDPRSTGSVVPQTETNRRSPILPAYRRELPPERERPKWMVPVIAVGTILLLVIAWSALRTKRNPAPAVAASISAPPLTAASNAPAPRPRNEDRPSAVGRPAQEPSARTAVAKEHRLRKDAWYVVVATYSQRQSAEHRAQEITKKWPRFPAHVFAPPVESPHFLVVIGASLSEADAEALRQRSLAAGLPHDAYIKRFIS